MHGGGDEGTACVGEIWHLFSVKVRDGKGVTKAILEWGILRKTRLVGKKKSALDMSG